MVPLLFTHADMVNIDPAEPQFQYHLFLKAYLFAGSLCKMDSQPRSSHLQRDARKSSSGTNIQEASHNREVGKRREGVEKEFYGGFGFTG
jgi:hypothetical protein